VEGRVPLLRKLKFTTIEPWVWAPAARRLLEEGHPALPANPSSEQGHPTLSARSF